MDYSFSTPSLLLDESDEPQTPLRSPSRLDFCMDGLEDGGSILKAEDDSTIHGMDWASTFHDNYPHEFVDEGFSPADIAPLDPSRLPAIQGVEGDSPSAMDSHFHENVDILHTLPISREQQMEQVSIEPQSPTPVRSLVMQFQLDTGEDMPPSRTAPQRLNYPHHGLSRSALLQQKTLWNSRHEEWVEWQSRMERGEAQKQGFETNGAYTGLATTQPCVVENPPPYMRTPPSGLERDLTDHPPKKPEQNVNASIFPRAGDISALRDPYSVNIDRCFCKFPLWTLHKTLYVFNMHQRSSSVSLYNTTPVQASMSSSTLSSYTSSGSGDDEESDSTLVADDSPIPKSSLLLNCDSSPHSLPPWNRFCGWELSWYARWELLIDLFQRDQTKCDALDMSVKMTIPVESMTAPSTSLGSMFRFIAGEDSEGNDDDQDQDYGTIVSASNFSADFNEECERAMAFYGRETACSEVQMTW